MATMTITKTDKRKAVLKDNKLVDVFLQGGESSIKFANAEILSTITVQATSIDTSRQVSKDVLIYID